MVLCCILEKLCDWKFDLDLLKTCLNWLKECLDDKKGLILLPVRFLISIICDIIELIVVATEYGLTFWKPEAFWITVFVLFIIGSLSFLVFLFVYAIKHRKKDEKTIESEKQWKVFGALIKASSFASVLFLFFETYTQASSKTGSLDTLGILIFVYSIVNLLMDFIYLIYSICIACK
jgi:heme/copper-type cytochrome/quinol oxidase subunit 2